MEYQQTKAGEAQPGTAVVFGCGYKPADDEAQTRKVLVLYDQGANIFMIDHEFTFCTTVQAYSYTASRALANTMATENSSPAAIFALFSLTLLEIALVTVELLSARSQRCSLLARDGLRDLQASDQPLLETTGSAGGGRALSRQRVDPAWTQACESRLLPTKGQLDQSNCPLLPTLPICAARHCGDGTPWYASYADALRIVSRVQRWAPAASFIVTLRNPVRAWWSLACMRQRNALMHGGNASAGKFFDAYALGLPLGASTAQGCARRPGKAALNDWYGRSMPIEILWAYAERLRTWRAGFAKHRFLLLRSDMLSSEGTLDRVWRFLGLRAFRGVRAAQPRNRAATSHPASEGDS